MNNTIFINFIFMLLFSNCTENDDKLNGSDVRLFKNTVVWELAKAVESENVEKIKKIGKELTNDINFQEPHFGKTLVEWATYTHRYESTKALLELGANPNLRNLYDGENALINAADIYDDSRFLKLVLAYGGDPNNNDISETAKKFPRSTTPLITAAMNGNLDNVKLLVEAGAEIDYITYDGLTALKMASLMNQVNNVKYFVIDKGADYKYPMDSYSDGENIYLTNRMRSWVYTIESEDWKCKMELVDFLKKNGMNYYDIPVPEVVKESFPQEYIDKY